MGRFADRTKRLTRRQESDVFRHYLMPIAWILGLAGLLGLVALWVGEGMERLADSAAFPVLVIFAGAPALTALLRAVRGHYHPSVRDL
jgi:hypothetical protein